MHPHCSVCPKEASAIHMHTETLLLWLHRTQYEVLSEVEALRGRAGLQWFTAKGQELCSERPTHTTIHVHTQLSGCLGLLWLATQTAMNYSNYCDSVSTHWSIGSRSIGNR